MVAKLSILKYGSNHNRMKLNHIPALDLTATKVLEPIIHGRNYKARSAVARGKRSKKSASKQKVDEDSKAIKKLVLSELDA